MAGVRDGCVDELVGVLEAVEGEDGAGVEGFYRFKAATAALLTLHLQAAESPFEDLGSELAQDH